MAKGRRSLIGANGRERQRKIKGKGSILFGKMSSRVGLTCARVFDGVFEGSEEKDGMHFAISRDEFRGERLRRLSLR